jgi:PAS domain S-box-containing protein
MTFDPDFPGHVARVLIVDDERHDRELLQIMLADQGFVLLTASSGDEALAVTAREHPDIVLLDVMMAGMDGYAVAAELKRSPDTMNIPIILITALDDRKAKMLGLDAGAEEFLSKPIDRAELQVRVRNTLRLKAYGDHHRRLLESTVVSHKAELLESETRYRQIVESTTDGIVKVDAAGDIVFANRRFAAMLGCDVAELVGTSAFSGMGDSARQALQAALKTCAEGGQVTQDTDLRRKDGVEVAVSLACSPVLDAEGRYAGALASARDVTEQKRLMAQLGMSDRMASIGTLAAGVGHEINNPLACVLANLDLAAADLKEHAARLGVTGDFAEVADELRDAREATERIRTIVRDLRIFSRSESEHAGAVDVEQVLDSTLRMAWNEIRHRARVVKSYEGPPLVQASEARLGQVFLNVIVNAAQAIVEGHADRNQIRVSTRAAPNGQTVVEIADSGPGMPPEVSRRLFTPFFTTKPAGVGTGLGLSICQRIVTGFGGTIEFSSAPGEGTVFRISLPRATAVTPTEVAPVALGAPSQRRGHVLVIDDEPMMAKTIARALSAEHDVIAVGNAGEALERIKGGQRFDVILCDVMMPQITGADLHAELCRSASPQAERIVFLTGGAFTPRAQAFLDETSNERLEKPFDIRQLRGLVNDRVRQIEPWRR